LPDPRQRAPENQGMLTNRQARPLARWKDIAHEHPEGALLRLPAGWGRLLRRPRVSRHSTQRLQPPTCCQARCRRPMDQHAVTVRDELPITMQPMAPDPLRRCRRRCSTSP